MPRVTLQQQLEHTMNEMQTPLLRYACRLVNDEAAAHDVVQESFIKLHRFVERGHALPEKVSAWMYRVTHNQAVDYIRKEQRRRAAHERQAEQREIFLGENQERNRQERIAMALEHLQDLPPRDRQVILLRLQEGKSYAEIAEIMEITQGNVGFLLHHAVKKLAELLKKRGALS